VVEDAATFILLRVRDEDGHEGVAEVAVKPTWVGATIRTLTATIEEIFAPLIMHWEFAHPPELRERLEGIPENLVAKTLIDIACWDLYASVQANPLWLQWSGGNRIPVSWTLTRQPPSAMAKEAAHMVKSYGFATLKMKGGQGRVVDEAAVREVQSAAGDNVRIYVDANSAYRPASAKDYVRMLADIGVFACEDPCPLLPDAEFRALQNESPIPLLVDYSCMSPRDAALFAIQGVRALSVKPGRFGFTWARKMAEDAAKIGTCIVPGLMGESDLGTLCGLQFASVTATTLWPAELTCFLQMQERVTNFSLQVVDGSIEIPKLNSAAESVDWHAVREYGASFANTAHP